MEVVRGNIERMLERRGLIGSIKWNPDDNGVMTEEDLFIAFIVDKKSDYKNFFEKLAKEKKKVYSHYIFVFDKDKDKLDDDMYDHFHVSDFYMDVVDDAPKPHFVRFKRITLDEIKEKNKHSVSWKVDDFPKMKRSDPLAKYYGARKGEIYEILLAGESTPSYRVII